MLDLLDCLVLLPGMKEICGQRLFGEILLLVGERPEILHPVQEKILRNADAR
jgi:hypothetical protein